MSAAHRQHLVAWLTRVINGERNGERTDARVVTTSELLEVRAALIEGEPEIARNVRERLDADANMYTRWAKEEERNPYEAHAYRTAAHALRLAKEHLC